MKRNIALITICLLLASFVLPAAAYTTLSMDKEDAKLGGTAIADLQRALLGLGYPADTLQDGTPSGVYKGKTHQGVVAFQQRNGLTISGVADSATQRKLFAGGAAPFSTPVTELPAGEGKLGVPAVSSVQLQHWYKTVKGKLRSGNIVRVTHPRSGISYNLRVYSPNYHMDAEPATFRDTQLMNRAFGHVPAWIIEVVYVQLPDSSWSLATTHNYPHMSWSIKDNGFGGHLCVHFLRDMDETRKNSGDYSVDHQWAIRKAWKNMTGQTVDDATNPEEYIRYDSMEGDEAALAQTLTNAQMDDDLRSLAREAAYQMALNQTTAFSHDGAAFLASARVLSQEEAGAQLLLSNPALEQAEFAGLGCILENTWSPNYTSEVYYWAFIGMTREQFAARYPEKLLIGQPGKLPGDANGDGTVDSSDMIAMIDYMISRTPIDFMDNADANEDDMVDIHDLVWIIDHMAGS
jgi:hypothetical protein